MRKRKKAEKPVHEMTTDELADKVFPKEVKEHLQKIARGEGGQAQQRSSPPKTTT